MAWMDENFISALRIFDISDRSHMNLEIPSVLMALNDF